MDFPGLLQEAQERLGFDSQKELAAYLEVDPSQLCRYMNGMGPRLPALESILKKLGYELVLTSPDPRQESAVDLPGSEDSAETESDQADGRVIQVDFSAKRNH